MWQRGILRQMSETKISTSNSGDLSKDQLLRELARHKRKEVSGKYEAAAEWGFLSLVSLWPYEGRNPAYTNGNYYRLIGERIATDREFSQLFMGGKFEYLHDAFFTRFQQHMIDNIRLGVHTPSQSSMATLSSLQEEVASHLKEVPVKTLLAEVRKNMGQAFDESIPKFIDAHFPSNFERLTTTSKGLALVTFGTVLSVACAGIAAFNFSKAHKLSKELDAQEPARIAR